MKKLYLLPAIVFIFIGVNLQSTEAAVEIIQANTVETNVHTLDNKGATEANTTSEVAEHNDLVDPLNDSTIKSEFQKEADGSLSMHIQQMLSSNVQLTGKVSDVKVIVVDGRVTLQGNVKSEEDRANIINQVENIAGVDGVENELIIAE